jgi:hypothetical protein
MTDQSKKSTGIRCVICERMLSESNTPDERTMALWLRELCRFCGDQLDVGVYVNKDGEVEDLFDTGVVQE